MTRMTERRCIAFEGTRRIASGRLRHVALRVKERIDAGTRAPVLVLDAATSEPVELDLRGPPEEIARRLDTLEAAASADGGSSPLEDGPGSGTRGPGRPRLGVVAREVTLLPRHWEWLREQPGGASVALRKLVEEARRANAGRDRLRRARDAAYRFMNALAGDEPGFEEAVRALYAGDAERFQAMSARWPADVRAHARALADAAFEESAGDAAQGNERGQS